MKLTKAQAKRRMKEILAKSQKLFMTGYMTQAEFASIQKMINKNLKKC